MSISIKNNINKSKIVNSIQNDVPFWTYAATQWHKQYEDFVPFDTGMLYTQVEFLPKEIIHTQVYANKVYNGNFNFRKTKHKFATRLWDVAAINAKKDEVLVKDLEEYIRQGRLKIDE